MTPILFNPDLGIDAAADLQRQLMPYMRQAEPLPLDGGQVQRVHTASLQLLCALFQSRRHSGLKTCWSAVSHSLHAAANVLGLAAALELPPTTTMETSV